MMFTHTFRQLTYLAAILALALVCAQTLAASHSHDLAEGSLCTICSASADEVIDCEVSIDAALPAPRTTCPSPTVARLSLSGRRDQQPRAPPRL